MIHHMSIALRLLVLQVKQYPDAEILRSGKRWIKGKEALATLARMKDEGVDCLPLCSRNECPDFDYTGGGCPGHEKLDNADYTAES